MTDMHGTTTRDGGRQHAIDDLEPRSAMRMDHQDLQCYWVLDGCLQIHHLHQRLADEGSDDE